MVGSRGRPAVKNLAGASAVSVDLPRLVREQIGDGLDRKEEATIVIYHSDEVILFVEGRSMFIFRVYHNSNKAYARSEL